MEVTIQNNKSVPLEEVDYGQCFKFSGDNSLYLLCEEDGDYVTSKVQGCWVVNLNTNKISVFGGKNMCYVVDEVKVVVS